MASEMNRPDSQGKVRDIYDLGEELLLVASDRISAFDFILPDEIPFKGEILTRISKFWFEMFEHIVPTHYISIDTNRLPNSFLTYKNYLEGRAMLVRKAQPIMAECIVRGYLTGSGKKEYDKTGTIKGIELPKGLVEASKLDEPIFTPSTKAEIGDHDENISFEELEQKLGSDLAQQLKEYSISLYNKAANYAHERGIIVADTKFEFGIIDGQVTLIDECITPDSSRFWPLDGYEEGKVQPSFDKQYVRDWLKANWNMTGDAPHLPQEVIDETSKKYIQAYELLTGEKFIPMKESR